MLNSTYFQKMANARRKHQQLTAAHRTMQQATHYSQWFEAASEWETLSGASAWRESPDAGLGPHLSYPHKELQQHQQILSTLLDEGDAATLLQFLTESLHRLLNDINDPGLYQVSPLGSKHLTRIYLDTVFRCIDFLTDCPKIASRDKLLLLKNAQKNLGVPALLLSGGGTFGIYHLGVIKALHQQALIPEIISGTSMGSIAAGILATHTSSELDAMFEAPRQRHHRPLKRLTLHEMLRQHSLLDSQRLYRCVQANVGDSTFAEAYARTGRTVSITVSPTRSGQKPRILNHLTSPNALISYASKASCSIPGLFPPVQLQQRIDGQERSYCADERWADGSFATDIPRQRMSRLFNVNFFIVSQANPHILPFVQAKQKDGVLPALQDVMTESLHAQSLAVLNVIRRRYNRAPWRSWIDQGASMVDQEYLGDITIHPKFSSDWYLKFMKNPTYEELDYLILSGERATWPMLARIREQTRLAQKLQASIELLEHHQHHSEAGSVNTVTFGQTAHLAT
ncbi:MAG: DUF3336 domain-containing protein [Hahellaceae bacterium]|nr:DUF3336 domain-containing protein [Hahellaceae bacterium]